MQSNETSDSGKYVGWGFLGFIIGGGIGFALRPGNPLFGRLPFETVITAGANLKGLDSLLKGLAQTSFLIMLAGAIIGALIAVIIVNLSSKNKSKETIIQQGFRKEDKITEIDLKDSKVINKEVLAIIEGYESKIGADPLNTNNILELANFLDKNALFDKAIPTLLKLITIDKGNITALKLLMDCYEKVERYEDAINTGKKIISIVGSDFEIINTMADQYFKLNNTEDGLKCLTIITKKDPNNLNAWLKKANTYETLGENSASLKAWQSVNRIDPRNTLSNLKIAINMADAGNYGEAISIFNKIIGDFDKQDVNLQILNAYLLWCTIQSDKAAGTKEIENLSSYVNPNELGKLSIANQDLLSDIIEYYGNIEFASGKYRSAISYYKEANDIKSSQEFKKKIAQAYLNRGMSSLSKKNIASAIHYFQEGQIYDPDNVQLENELSSIFSKSKRKKVLRFSLAAAVLLVIGVCYGMYYFSFETLNITVSPKANVEIVREKDLISPLIKEIAHFHSNYDASNFKTDYLFSGTYLLKAEKEGYEPIVKSVKTGFGRKEKNVSLNLNPIFGSIKIDSEPSNATVLIKNKNQEETCKTPCEIENIFALESEIKVSLPTFNSYKTKIKILQNDVSDLGKIVFRGSLEIDSNPPGANFYINSKYKGKTPIIVNNLPAKETKIELSKKDEGNFYDTVNILPGKTTRLRKIQLTNFVGEWKGFWKHKNNKTSVKLYLKKKPGLKCSGAAFCDPWGYETFDGSSDQNGKKLVLYGNNFVHYGKKWDSWTYDKLDCILSENGKKLVCKTSNMNKGINGNGDIVKSKRPTKNTGVITLNKVRGNKKFSKKYNNNMRYFLQTGRIADRGKFFINNRLIANIPEKMSMKSIEITPLLLEGENVLTYKHFKEYGDRWEFDITIKRIDSKGKSKIIFSDKKKVRNDQKNGLRYVKDVKFTYTGQ